jgi:SAM-dependent methyltransferase
MTQTKLHYLESNYDNNYMEAWVQIYCHKAKPQSIVQQEYKEPVDFEKIKVQVRKENAEYLSFAADNTYDAVYSPLCLYVVGNWENVGREIYRVLRPGCPMAFTVIGWENHTWMQVLVESLKEIGVVVPRLSKAGLSKLSDEKMVIETLEKIGFKCVRSFEVS